MNKHLRGASNNVDAFANCLSDDHWFILTADFWLDAKPFPLARESFRDCDSMKKFAHKFFTQSILSENLSEHEIKNLNWWNKIICILKLMAVFAVHCFCKKNFLLYLTFPKTCWNSTCVVQPSKYVNNSKWSQYTAVKCTRLDICLDVIRPRLRSYLSATIPTS